MNGINKVILVGTLGRDPESRYTPNGLAVTTLSLATSEQWKDKQTGEKKESTEWHRVVIFGALAEIAAKYLKKGSQIYIEGSLKTRKWQNKEGQDQYTTEIVASVMQMLGGGRSEGGRTPAETTHSSPQAAPKEQASPAHSTRGQPKFDDFEDDMPF